jgi:putative NADPH-quinone reductase
MVGKRTDMKTLIVFTHPHEGSYGYSILEAVKAGLKKGGHACKVINLDKDGFDPVMREKDLKAFAELGRGETAALSELDPIVLRYKKKLEWADGMVMIFPTWWMTMPAIMKGFVDKVIFPGVAYEMENGRLKSRLRNLKQVTVISTMNTPADIYRDRFNNSIEGSLIKGTFNQIGIHDARWISLNMVKQVGEEVRAQWLEELEERFATL